MLGVVLGIFIVIQRVTRPYVILQENYAEEVCLIILLVITFMRGFIQSDTFQNTFFFVCIMIFATSTIVGMVLFMIITNRTVRTIIALIRKKIAARKTE